MQDWGLNHCDKSKNAFGKCGQEESSTVCAKKHTSRSRYHEINDNSKTMRKYEKKGR